MPDCVDSAVCDVQLPALKVAAADTLRLPLRKVRAAMRKSTMISIVPRQKPTATQHHQYSFGKPLR